jgi:hypothetical protein
MPSALQRGGKSRVGTKARRKRVERERKRREEGEEVERRTL